MPLPRFSFRIWLSVRISASRSVSSLSLARDSVGPVRSVSITRTRPTPSMQPTISSICRSMAARSNSCGGVSSDAAVVFFPAGSSISTTPKSSIIAGNLYRDSTVNHFSFTVYPPAKSAVPVEYPGQF